MIDDWRYLSSLLGPIVDYYSPLCANGRLWLYFTQGAPQGHTNAHGTCKLNDWGQYEIDLCWPVVRCAPFAAVVRLLLHEIGHARLLHSLGSKTLAQREQEADAFARQEIERWREYIGAKQHLFDGR